MGNKIHRKRAAVEERYTRPQGLYQHRDVDYKKLRRLILDSKLAPCYPGVDDSPEELEECLICFLCYPSLNSSKCCLKGICTECFLRVKSPHATRTTQCPFCKTANYAVEYRGTRTPEEKDLEQIEEQKVIEAKIKIQQQEVQAEERQAEHLEDEGNSSVLVTRPSGSLSNTSSNGLPLLCSLGLATRKTTSNNQQTQHNVGGFIGGNEQGSPLQIANGSSSCADSDESSSSNAVVSVQEAELSLSAYKHSRREEDFLLDLEGIMMMEAIWQSIQEQEQSMIFQQNSDLIASASTPLLDCLQALQKEESGCSRLKFIGIRGLSSKNNFGTGCVAVAIAKLAERRVLSGANSLFTQVQEMVSSDLLEFGQPCNGLLNFQPALSGTDNSGQEAAQAPTVEMRQSQCQSPTHTEDGDVVHANLSFGGTMQACNESSNPEGANGLSSIPKIAQNEDSSHNYRSRPQEALISNSAVGEVDVSFSDSMVSTSDTRFTVSEACLNDGHSALVTNSVQLGAALTDVPKTFEEQMILAMTLSCAEAYMPTSV